jgi:DNA-binding winged helix-turn-helix (wHTH) protein/TolB-like protein
MSPVTFGVFVFDAASGALTREGTPVRLQPQPARVLGILVNRAGDVVSRDELRQQIWNDRTFVDFERGLNFCIAQIRGALKDSADSPRFIETIPRRGYRFIAPVRRLTEPVSAPPPAIAPVIAPPPALAPVVEIDAHTLHVGRRKPWLAAIAIGILAVTTAGLVVGTWRVATAGDRRTRIAVVPFDNETGLNDFDAIARGVADATVARLATPERVQRLSVIGNAAALYQPRAFRDLRRIGTALRADYVVLAQMKRDASRVRLIAHLIRVSDETHLWANTYDRAAFTLDVQAEIAESIASAVVERLAKPSSSRS